MRFNLGRLGLNTDSSQAWCCPNSDTRNLKLGHKRKTPSGGGAGWENPGTGPGRCVCHIKDARRGRQIRTVGYRARQRQPQDFTNTQGAVIRPANCGACRFHARSAQSKPRINASARAPAPTLLGPFLWAPPAIQKQCAVAGTVFGLANCIAPHWDIPLLGGGPRWAGTPAAVGCLNQNGLSAIAPRWGRFL